VGGGGSPFVLALDETLARREVENEYEERGNRILERHYGGLFVGDERAIAPEHGERYDYNYPGDQGGANIPWPYEVRKLERIPGQEGLEETTWTRFKRDLQGRPLETTSSDGSILYTTYDRLGGAIRTETGAGTVTRMVFDGRGRLMLELRPDGRGRTAFAYDIDGRLLARETQRLDDGGTVVDTSDDSWQKLWGTGFTYDAAGRVKQIDHADGSSTVYDEYNPDNTVAWMTTRDGIQVDFEYDRANRLLASVPSGALPPTMVELDPGDHYEYDELSRVTFANRRVDPHDASPMRVATEDYDLGGRLGAEVVGTRQPLKWSYDAWDRPEFVELPDGLGRDPAGAFTGWRRDFDTIDRLTGVSSPGLPQIGASWTWGGRARLYGIDHLGPAETSIRFAYQGQPDSVLPAAMPAYGETWRLATIDYGAGAGATTTRLAEDSTWGGFAFGWRGNEAEPSDGAKIGRVVTGPGLTDGMGWSWNLDTALRLVDAHAGPGSYEMNDDARSVETTSFSYGQGDQLERITSSHAAPVGFTYAEYGRIAARDGAAFGYDSTGRRTSDDRFSYRWDWRGRLYEVTVAPDAGTSYDGHQVNYEYDALGRLLYRVHLGTEDGSARPFIEYRAYLWEGNGLLAEAGYGSNDGTWDDPVTDLFLRWRKTYVPGPSGLDDAMQVRVEIEVPADTEYSDTVYSYLRDELGTVLGMVEERVADDPGSPPLVVRYFYTPYGEVRVELAEDFGGVLFENGEAGFDFDSVAAASSDLDGRFPGGQNCLFQGLWTDPVTGISYARNRWYDARTASWLSEDPKGAVDSPNLYAFVGWGPHRATDPMGLVTDAQMTRYLRLLKKASRNSKGYHGERVLERLLKRSGRTILLGPTASGKNVNAAGADAITYNPETGKIEFWDHKFLLARGNSTSRNVSSVSTFTVKSRMDKNLAIARDLIEKSDLPNKVDLLASFSTKDYGVFVAGVGPGNTVSGITKRLKDAGIKFAEPEFIMTGKNAPEGPGIGRRIVKGVGLVGTAIAIVGYASDAAAGVEEDAEYMSWVSELQAYCEDCTDNWLIRNSSLIRALGKAGGEEVGGNVGAGLGAAGAGLVCIETGPLAIGCAVAGGVAGGVAGDEVGRRVGGGTMDLILDAAEYLSAPDE
jgi:RHS repeat-associated protein